jgi:hypothetical protein
MGLPDVFKFSIGTTTALIPDGWCGVVALNYAEGWIEIDTRYRWTRAERLATAGVVRRAWMRLSALVGGRTP